MIILHPRADFQSFAGIQRQRCLSCKSQLSHLSCRIFFSLTSKFCFIFGDSFSRKSGFQMKQICVLNDSDYFKVLERSGSSHCHPRLFFSPWLPNIWFWMQNLFNLVLYILKKPKSFIQLFVLNSVSQVKFHFLSRFTSKKQMLNIGVWVKSLLFIYILLCLIFRLHIVNS